MTIKLTPEHVGTRVLLDNGCIGVVTSFFKLMVGPRFEVAFGTVSLPFSMAIYDDDGIFERDEDHEQYPHGNTAKWRVVLLLDAPNPMDVEVPEWCDRITLWSRTADFILTPLYHEESRERLISGRIRGWSPAPGEMPRRGATDDGE